MNGRFTVIIPVYNNSDMLKDCIDSVLIQNYSDIEIIIADDKSLVFREQELFRYINDNQHGNISNIAIYQNEKNLGTVKNLNQAIKRSTGVYIKIIAADDLLYDPKVLSQVVEKFNDVEDGVLICDVMQCDENLNYMGRYKSEFLNNINLYSSQKNFENLCVRNYIKAAGVFFTKSFFDDNGLFDEKYRLLEDWPTWLSFFLKEKRMVYKPILAVKYRIDTGVIANSNPYYLKDRKLVFKDLIQKNKNKISFTVYLKAFFSTYLFTNLILRKIYFKLSNN